MCPLSPPLVIFDLDDTLLATSRAVVEARRMVLKELNPHWGPTDVARGLRTWRAATAIYRDTTSLSAILDVIYVAAGARRDTYSRDRDAELQGAYRQRIVEGTDVNPQVLDAARRLEWEGCVIGVVSNGDRAEQLAKVERVGLVKSLRSLRVVVCDGVELPYKPDPAGLIQLVGDRRTDDAVFVGDRMTDILAGKLAGVKTVLLRSRTADYDRGICLRAVVTADDTATLQDCYASISALVRPPSSSAQSASVKII